MNRISGFGSLFKMNKNHIGGAVGAEMDDHMLTRHMRSMAVKMRTDGTARLNLAATQSRRLGTMIQNARQLEACCADAGEALKRLVQDARLMEACVEQARQDGGLRLPACEGVPRIGRIMDVLCLNGEMRITRDRLMLALASFDDVQALTMKELWAVPEAMRISLSHGFIRAAEGIISAARCRAEAEKWVQDPDGSLHKRGKAFFERALQLAAEQEMPDVRNRLEAFLSEKGEAPERVVRLAHEAQAMDQMHLDNLLANKRLIDSLDWQECFEELSTVDAELRYDPADVYSNMDDQSRAAVRQQVEMIANRLRLGEMTIARHAVGAAQSAKREGGAQTTICYWLMDDAGRRGLLKRMGIPENALPLLVPDPEGKKSIAIMGVLTTLLSLMWIGWVHNPWLWLPGIPLVWMASNALIGAIYPKIFPPARLLKLEVNHVPDAWRTLVVMPVLLSNPERATEICEHMESLGCLERDKNIQYLLLGDFSDGPLEHQKDDEAIVAQARECISAMNERAGREKYAYLHRPRTWLEVDQRWMGFDRKRGALMALNSLLVGAPEAEQAFEVEGAACEGLKNRFAFVVTLDADTCFLPGTVQKLIGTIAHPLNRISEKRGYAVLQPQMEMVPSACVNAFVRLFAGSGGVNTYPVSISNMWQDITATGIFAGKGIYDVRAFHAALEGALPEGRILSHDLIEGTIARAGFVGDIAFYDGYPTSLSSCMRRLNRWTRGDWQLLPLLFSRKAFPNGHRFSGADRLRMLDNLLRSLLAPALLIVLIGAIWTGDGNALLGALVISFFRPILSLFGSDTLKWRRATAELAVLPVTAWSMFDAISRTLWRLTVSGKHMLDWVTAADAESRRDDVRMPGRVAAILLIPGLFVRGWIPATVAMAALFLVAPGWVHDMESESLDAGESLSTHQISVLTALARDTWRFFEKYVSMNDGALPPDNVQLDPPVGAARRTSPTNIGLYLMSSLAAERMGFIRKDEMRARMSLAMDAMDQMEKWQGHLFNWYDIDSLHALRPRYVSAVDSGNLAASLLLCASALEKDAVDEALAARMRILAEEMNFKTLYDRKRELFVIGADVDSGRLSESHYDLLASESRILSYVTMMLEQIPVRHWQKLSRPCVPVGKDTALVSWSGTMFEYLMPELFMRSPGQSLLGASNRAVVQVQKQLAQAKARPWGVSESGYYAFDMHMNYQYRAFGLRALALGGNAMEGVVAPYASVLALPVAPAAVAQNVARMREMGWAGECGLYEAADYTRHRADGSPAIVKSHMAHHQGMILCALCNVLTNGSLIDDFMRIPQARALSLMLEEKPYTGVRLRGQSPEKRSNIDTMPEARSARNARLDARLAEAHLLYGADATALVTADGAVHYMRNGVCATRFDGDMLNRRDGACVHVRNVRTGDARVLGGKGCRVVFDAGSAAFIEQIEDVKLEMTMCVSPEDGSFIRAIEMSNGGNQSVELILTDVAPVALAPAADIRAHAIFRNLFVESTRIARCAVAFKRRPRAEDEVCPVLVHMVSAPGEVNCETDYEKLVGRFGDTLRADGIAPKLSNTTSTVLNPVSALQTTVKLAPGEHIRMHFAMAILEPEANLERWLDGHLSETLTERALQLSGARAQAMLGFIGLKASQHHLLQRLSALLFDGHLAASAREDHRPADGVSRSTLWQLGISGDRPILAMRVTDGQQTRNVYAIIRAHEFYRAMGVWIDLVLINDLGGGYDQPVRDMLTEQIASSHLRDLGGQPGGVWLIDGQQLTEAHRDLLRRAASATFSGDRDFYQQVRSLLTSLDIPAMPQVRTMALGTSTLPAIRRDLYNGYGGFLTQGGYAIDVLPSQTTPAPWANILANDLGGILLTERAGGFIWRGNSRNGRLTAFGNDALSEGWGMMLYLKDADGAEATRLLPGKQPEMPFRVYYNAAETRYEFQTQRLSGAVDICMHGDAPEVRMHVTLENHGLNAEKYQLIGFVDWLMGIDAQDASWLNTWSDCGACYASGTAEGVGYFAAANAGVETGAGRNAFLGRGSIMNPEGLNAPAHPGGWTLNVPVALKRGARTEVKLVIGWAENVEAARTQVRAFYADGTDVAAQVRKTWDQRMEQLVIETPDVAINHLANDFLIHQSLSSRVCGRTGLYQPGGAYGFRDQLQDMLSILHFEPQRVREHILRSTAHQFESGDVMHWWHEPWLGVRTQIKDDMLFLPYVTAAYVKHTQDFSILDERIAYLEDVEIPEGKEDIFCEMRPGNAIESLHDHCMRAFRKASGTGERGLSLMGTGDWNDSMNRVGEHGRGESVWLSEFLSACAAKYAEIAPTEADCAWLNALSDQMNAAIEEFGWDGEWYLRAYNDDGEKLGGSECKVCQIDAISQAWAVMAGLDAERCAQAMNSAWQLLVDREIGIVRLLTPPFDGDCINPGYIRGYPAGVRENGAQYTHGACWLLLAMIQMGDAERAHAVLHLMLPPYHSDNRENARNYRVEPYVMAADIYSVHPNEGRGGWTWYTGAAAWLHTCILRMLGYERRGNRVRMNALLGDWPSASVTVRFGSSRYKLICERNTEIIMLDGVPVKDAFIQMQDDGRDHEAHFPARQPEALLQAPKEEGCNNFNMTQIIK